MFGRLFRAMLSLEVVVAEGIGGIGRLENCSGRLTSLDDGSESILPKELVEKAGTGRARGLRLGLERNGELAVLVEADDVDECAAGGAMAASSIRRLLASIFCRTMLRRKSGICCHCPSLAAFRSLGCIAGLSIAGRVPGILAFGDRSEERKGKPPASTASFNHCSHSSSMTVAGLPASRCATAARNLSFNSTPTLWISLSESSPSPVSSSSASSPSCMPSISSTFARWACGATGIRSSGSTYVPIPSEVVSRMIIPCSFSNRSFAHLVPSHFVKPAISDFVRPRLSKARKSLRCHGKRDSRRRCGW